MNLEKRRFAGQSLLSATVGHSGVACLLAERVRLTRAILALALRAVAKALRRPKSLPAILSNSRFGGEGEIDSGHPGPRAARRRQGAPASKIAPGDFVELAIWRRG